MEAASDARYMHDVLRKMLRSPVFLDSSTLTNLSNLIAEGVHKSDCVLLLATKGVFTRPWCLIELLEAVRKAVPVVIVQIANGGFDSEEARRYAMTLETEMKEINLSGLERLKEHLGSDLTELKAAIVKILDANQGSVLTFDSHAGDNATLAAIKDMVERMAHMADRHVQWEGEARRESWRPLRRPSSRSTELSRGGSASDLMVQELTLRNNINDVNNDGVAADATGRAVFVCCSRCDAIKHARVLRSELEARLGCSCAIGGGNDSATLVDSSQALVVLLTKKLPTDANALLEIWKALECGLPVVSVAVIGGGFDFEEAANTFANLASSKAAVVLQAKLPAGATNLTAIGKMLQASLGAIIAIAWSPQNGRNHMDAVVDDILNRMPRARRPIDSFRRARFKLDAGGSARSSSQTSGATSSRRSSRYWKQHPQQPVSQKQRAKSMCATASATQRSPGILVSPTGLSNV